MTACSWTSSSKARCSGSSRCSPTSRPTLTVRAQEDTLCYLVPPETADPLLGSRSGVSFVIGSMRRRITSAAESSAGAADPRLTPVGSLVRREPVTADPSTPVAEAAARMADERVSSLLIPTTDGWGIVTDRDLRTRLVAVGADPSIPVVEIATFPVRTIDRETLAGAALLGMFADGIHHYPVTEPGGRIVGVVTDTDLMGIGRHTPFAVRSAIERARTAEEVAAAGRELPGARRGDGGCTHRPDRRRAGGGAGGRRADRPVAPPDDRAPRGPAVRVGLARAGERGPARTGAAHGPGSCARLRSDPRPARRRSVLRRAGRVRHGRPRSGGHPPMHRRRHGDPPDAAATDRRVRRALRGLDGPPQPESHGVVLDRVRLPAGRRPARRRTHAGRRRAPGAAQARVPPDAVAAGARPEAADRVRAQPGGGGQGRARRTARHQTRRDHDRDQPRAHVGGPRRHHAEGTPSPAWMPPRTPRRTRSTPTSRGSCPRPSTSCGRSGSGIKPSRWQRASRPTTTSIRRRWDRSPAAV